MQLQPADPGDAGGGREPVPPRTDPDTRLAHGLCRDIKEAADRYVDDRMERRRLVRLHDVRGEVLVACGFRVTSAPQCSCRRFADRLRAGASARFARARHDT